MYLNCGANQLTMEESFEKYLSINTGIPENEIHVLTHQILKKDISKGTLLLREGEICSKIFFVEKGLLRIYTIDSNGKEHIIQFSPENWWFSDRGSLYFEEPSDYFVEAIEDSRVVFLEKELFDFGGPNNDLIRSFNDKLLNNHIRQLQKRINLLLSATAEQRYLNFVKIYPDIMLRVPQWMIASYLGITPEGLSRVRRELARHNRS